MSHILVTLHRWWAGESPGRLALRQFAESSHALTGLGVFLILLAVAILCPLIAPQNPYDLKALDIMDAHLPPGSVSLTGVPFYLGTDTLGRDLFSAILYGLRTSITVGIVSTSIALCIGVSLGLTAGWNAGWMDS